MTDSLGWYYLKKCPVCSKVAQVLADPGVSPDSLVPTFVIRCLQCGGEIELTAKDLRKRNSRDV
ncbi:MAG: hypothetical protein M3Z54_07590 [Gemmatimonadota bacterium]|nr:hypothetical protein [Gemmatimonadota bacterium]